MLIYKRNRNEKQTDKESEMLIVVKIWETTELSRSEGALLQVKFLAKGVFSDWRKTYK
jgi:hypothetical protein